MDTINQEHDSCGIGMVVNIKGKNERRIVEDALGIVERLEHRAGKDATGETGDGVGILTSIPHTLFSKVAKEEGWIIGEVGDYAIGVFFFPADKYIREQSKKMIESLCTKENLCFLGWRTVPIDSTVLGKVARDCMPCIMQCFVSRYKDKERREAVGKGLEFERKLYLVRREAEKLKLNTYIVSFSSRTIVYKGMFLVKQLRVFYKDLQSADYKSCVALVHSRFSTNTYPSWKRAHPYRYIAHNGEINTIRGNIDRMLGREESIKSTVFSREEMQCLLPAVDTLGSDSAILDNTIEFLVMNGIPLPKAVMLCIPEPFRNNEAMNKERQAFYHYYSTMMEAWDGPAAVLFTDGIVAGSCLDRNGLRPARYYITRDDRLILASEVGTIDIEESNILRKERLEPGRMLLVNMEEGRLISDEEIKEKFSSSAPYGEWLDSNLVQLKDLPIPNKKILTYSQEERDKIYKAFGYNYEEVNELLLPMAREAKEPIGSMGTDIPLAILSARHPPLFDYFKQLFAQVTNPPIDSLREKIVTDTCVYVGSDGNILEENAKNARVLEIHNPILTGTDLLKIKALCEEGLKTATVSLLYYKNASLEEAINALFVSIEKEYRAGNNIIILSDRGVDAVHVAIPVLLAVSSVEQYLIRTKKRTALSIIAETAEVRTVHQAALLLSYGARAINPYLAHECIAELIDQKLLDKDYHAAIEDYNKALLSGIVKIASKMGISTIQSYQSAQIFEAVGISKEVIDRYFTNTLSRVGGIGLEEIAEDVNYHHNKAFDPLGLALNTHLDSVGVHKMRRGEGAEDHLYSPETIIALQEATRKGSYEKFKEYTALVDENSRPHTLRALLAFDYDKASKNKISLEEVESVEEIVKHFKTGAMSYGSISLEAHKCLAEAMNTIGGKSNSGEGGEIKERLGTLFNSAIKQVASARFGVTEEYLLSAKEIQIKMAQGAKPGEGGHLPGKKVYPWIAETRYATPGVSLISPPPHHDIYSIEDLAQLIYDLKCANENARISVKLVSEGGVGTVACGVAKAGSQVILISGHDGGTGAAPLSSIHHAGLPWELGLSETHRALVENGLRSRVVLETDGKLMSGRDVAVACLLGAEEFGFATAPLVTLGCCMMRACNLDTCPVGIATQNKKLRTCFKGKAEYVINFMHFIAQELREIMSNLGFRSIEEMAGHSEYLKVKDGLYSSNIKAYQRANLIKLNAILGKASDSEKEKEGKTHFIPSDIYDFHLEKTLDKEVLIKEYERVKDKKSGKFSVKLSCVNRTCGTLLGSRIQKDFGSSLPEDSFIVDCQGSAGQSFAAFIPQGLTMRLTGDANDYVGKGLSGGKIVIKTPEGVQYKAFENIIIGNVALYGATKGEAFINGKAGERFAVRNSGASGVVEGVGDHGAEYMTGGVLLVLGEVGRNFAAGMSGGVCYVLDVSHTLYLRLNKEMINVSEVTSPHDIDVIKSLLEKHVKETASTKAQEILGNFSSYIKDFKKIIPKVYERVIQEIAEQEKKGLSESEAKMQAFLAVTQGK